MAQDPAFEISVSVDESPTDTLLIGLSNFGLADLTAVDHLIKQQNSTEIGHIITHNIPDIMPFEEGEPRLPLRLYTIPDLDLTVLVGELVIPPWAAEPFVEALVEWTSSAEISEITILHGVPFPHGPDEHDVFYVASPPYRRERLTDLDIAPLKGGYLDGVVAELLTYSLAERAPPVGVITTPIHPPGPDFDAAVLFLEALQRIYGFTIDEQELRRRAEEMKQYYTELANRMERLEGTDQPLGSRDFPEDRMYM